MLQNLPVNSFFDSKNRIENKFKFKYLYEFFIKYYEMQLEMLNLNNGMINETTDEYKIYY